MSNFNGNTGNESGLDNGSADIFVNSIKINDISTPGLPLKVDANKEIYSTTLDISDTSGLQAALDATITNPYVGVLQASDFRSDNINSYNTTIQSLVASNATKLSKIDVNDQSIVSNLTLSDNTKKITTERIDVDNISSKAGSIGTINLTGTVTQIGSQYYIENSTTPANNFRIDMLGGSTELQGRNGDVILKSQADKVIIQGTELEAQCPIKTTSTTQSSSSITGSIQTYGGLGVVGFINNGDGINTDGNLTAVDVSTANITSVDTDLVLVKGQILNIDQEILNLQNTKYDKTGGILTGDLIHNGNNVQLQGSGSIQIQNQGTVQIQPTGALTMKGHGVLGEINMSNNKITNLANPINPLDAATRNYVDTAISGIPPVDLTDLNIKTLNISLTQTNSNKTQFDKPIYINDLVTQELYNPSTSLKSDVTIISGSINDIWDDNTSTFLEVSGPTTGGVSNGQIQIDCSLIKTNFAGQGALAIFGITGQRYTVSLSTGGTLTPPEANGWVVLNNVDFCNSIYIYGTGSAPFTCRVYALAITDFSGNVQTLITNPTSFVLSQSATRKYVDDKFINPNITGDLSVSGKILPTVNGGGDLGSSSLHWDNLRMTGQIVNDQGAQINMNEGTDLRLLGNSIRLDGAIEANGELSSNVSLVLNQVAPPANKPNFGKLYMNNSQLKYQFAGIEYPIAGNGISKVVKKFSPNAATTILYDDNFITIRYIQADLQPSFVLKTTPSGQGGFPSWVDTSIVFVGGNIGTSGNGDGIGTIGIKCFFYGNITRNTNYNHLNYGSTSRCMLCAESDLNYPTYTLNLITGDLAWAGVSIVERF